MADIKLKYPASNADSAAFTITLASLASDTNQLAGRESTAIDNRTNLDLDIVVSGLIKLGTSPTVDRIVAVYAYAAHKITSGTPEYPDVLDGTDSNETITSAYVKNAMLKLLWSGNSDAVTGRNLWMPPTSILQVFGTIPPFLGLFVVHDTGVALDSTGSNHYLHYHRIQAQTV